MSEEVNKSQYVLPLDQPVVYLDAQAAFDGLTDKEKLYSYYLSQAAWKGGLTTFIQTSVESGPVFIFLHKLFSAQSPSVFRNTAVSAGFTEDEVTAFFVYTAGVFSNSGNYKGFGDTKFIPDIEPTRLEELIKLSPVWESELQPLWNKYSKNIFDLSEGRTCLGLPPHGCNTYLSKNCKKEDNDIVHKWLKSKGLEFYNNRCFKHENNGTVKYEIRMASAEIKEGPIEEMDGYQFQITWGDYSAFMKMTADNLEKAIPNAANATEAEMLKCYVKSFRNGSLQEHKDGSRLWIKDKSPAIETYIGFIETYRDPMGMRGEFEGFVAAVNRPMSEKFTTLVNNAESLLPLLPWSHEFEKDKFLQPDFTSLDVLTFAGSGIPSGINIPNYDEVRQSDGFKNVSLGNVIPASHQQTKIHFLSETDAELLQKYRIMSFEVQVGLHELLGHGSGKLFQVDKDGKTNYSKDVIDPLTGKPIASHYEPGDTYDSIFAALGSAYEECRAEAVGLFLSLEDSILKIFGHVEDAQDIKYVNWLSLVWAGLYSLEVWDTKRGWLQAHSQARFAIMRVLIEAGVVSVTSPKLDDILVSMDREKFKVAGKKAIGDFLLKLQVYKSTANIKAAQGLFDYYTSVTDSWLNMRTVVLANKRPRKMFTQSNMLLTDDKVSLKNYDSTLEGLIQSWVERFDNKENVYSSIMKVTEADAAHF